ncbi:MAG: hypothetical protein LBG31_01980 [Prevotellaceae bacterium]|nr:hypothetical protein [Prevotellaceae bacterium]
MYRICFCIPSGMHPTAKRTHTLRDAMGKMTGIFYQTTHSCGMIFNPRNPY